MNKTIIGAAGAALTVASLLAATPASASTSPCMTARFTCGTFVTYQPESMAIDAPGWAAAADAAGAPVVMEPDRAGSRASDFELIHRDRDTRVEYAPGGHESHLYVGEADGPSYVSHGVKVTPGSLVLMGWNASWAERWVEVPDHGGTALENDYSGLYALPAAVGQEVRTGAPRHFSTVALEFQGNANGGN